MGSNLQITKSIEKYIEEYSQSLHPVQKEIISYNESLGEIKKIPRNIAMVGGFLFFLGLFIFVVFKEISKAPLHAVGDPLMGESERFHY